MLCFKLQTELVFCFMHTHDDERTFERLQRKRAKNRETGILFRIYLAGLSMAVGINSVLLISALYCSCQERLKILYNILRLKFQGGTNFER